MPFRLFILIPLLLTCVHLKAQQDLPFITVRNLNGRVVVSWTQHFTQPITNILIQRSFDSSKHFKTIGSVLNPQSVENGFPDPAPPYDAMYYRVNVQFEGGSYVYGPSVRPTREPLSLPDMNITYIPTRPEPEPAPVPKDPAVLLDEPEAPQGRITRSQRKNNTTLPSKAAPTDSSTTTGKDLAVAVPKKPKIETAYPSSRIYTSRQNVIVLHFPDYQAKKYLIRFMDENEQVLFELKKISDEFLYLEKSNFNRSGWFRFEVYEEGTLSEKSKFFVSRDKG